MKGKTAPHAGNGGAPLPEPIAIVGYGGVFPGARTLEQLWKIVEGGVDVSRPVPNGRWILNPKDIQNPAAGTPDCVYTDRGCFIEDFQLDPTGLQLPDGLLETLDPSFHLLLEAGRNAWLSTKTGAVDRSRVGIVLGNIALPTDAASSLCEQVLTPLLDHKSGTSAGVPIHGTAALNRYVAGMPAGILAQALRLGGGTSTVDAACASSLYALKLACDELQAGRADAMLAGGLSRPDSLYTQMGFCQLRALSHTGICSPFDAEASGLIVGEGAGVLVLKRLSDALKDGDSIHAVIRGIGLSNDLEGNLLSPSSEGQLRALKQAYQQAGWTPSQVDIIECHATGTPVGDAVEFASLSKLWEDAQWSPGQCVLGAVKANIGHLLTAAGSASLIKILLALKHNTLPATANFHQPSDKVPIEGSPFAILQQSQPWQRQDVGTPRRAAINGFGFGGINAHVLIEEWMGGEQGAGEEGQSLLTSAATGGEGDQGCPIAIVGMSAHVGPWSTLSAFQERVVGGGDGEEPSVRSHWRGISSDETNLALGFGQGLPGYYLNDLAIPMNRYRIPPKELAELLPQQALMLEVARAALGDAQLAKIDSARAGVFVGLGLDLRTTDFHFRWAALQAKGGVIDASAQKACEGSGPALTADRTLGALAGVNASRIAKEFHFGGTSYTVCSEDCSGVRALEIAVRALQKGEIDQALAGAVDLTGDLRALAGTDAVRPYSRNGATRPFDVEADGPVPGEGAVAVVLKRLDDARRDGDRVYAVIRGIGAAHEAAIGEVESSEAYENALKRAYQESGIDPASVDYVDADASARPKKDEREAKILNTFFASPQRKTPCRLGSAKADAGHTGAASGLVSVVKASLALYQEILPALRGLQQPLPELASSKNLVAPMLPQYWVRDRADGPRRAGVSASSVDGNIMHVVLEGCEESTDGEFHGMESRLQAAGANTSASDGNNGSAREMMNPDRLKAGLHTGVHSRKGIAPDSEALFVCSANDGEGLIQQLQALRSAAQSALEERVEMIARRWRQNNSKATGSHVLALVAQDAGQITRLVDAAIVGVQRGETPANGTGQDRDRIFYATPEERIKGGIAFVFPGAGNDFIGMGRELALRWPEILRAQDRENQSLRSQMFTDRFWNAASSSSTGTDHRTGICGQVALGSMISDLAVSLGIKPEAAIGYSLGESTGLFALRAWTSRDEMLRRVTHSTLFAQDLTGTSDCLRKVWDVPQGQGIEWKAGVVDRPAAVVREAMAGRKRIYVLIVNTPNECVIGGDATEVLALVEKLGCHWFPLEGVSTVHCELLGPVEKAYREMHLFDTTAPAGIRFFSGGWGREYVPDRETAADAIVAQASDCIDFPRVVRAAFDSGIRFFIEMGPGNSCSRMIGQILDGRPHVARSLCATAQEPLLGVFRVLGHLVAEGIAVDLGKIYPGLAPLEGDSIRGNPPHPSPLPQGGEGEEGRPLTPALSPQRGEGEEARAASTPHREIPCVRIPITGSILSRVYIPASIPGSVAGVGANCVDATEVRVPPLGGSPPAIGVIPLDPFEEEFIKAMAQTQEETLSAHQAYLNFSQGVFDSLSRTVQSQLSMIATLSGDQTVGEYHLPEPIAAPAVSVALDREACLEFARGSVARVLGGEFSKVDTFPTRVRLPDEPLMLVDRIMEIHGEARSMTHGRVVTEHDIHPGCWYLDGNRIPTCIAVEAGQADLFLSGYLGIDFITEGLAVYRLLDAKVRFHCGLPGPGSVIRYDIHIDHFFRQGNTWLFRFHFESTVNGEPLLTMTEGCAGFFSAGELAGGKGIIRTSIDLKPMPGKRPSDWVDLVSMGVESYSAAQLDALRAGDFQKCFGEQFAHLSLKRPVTLPSGRMRLVHRIPHLDPVGGRFGMGLIRGEADIHPNDWFLTCHFVDDRVMPGTLMYECCMHTLRVFLLRMGWVAEQDQAALEPVPGVVSQLKCRGQVLETTSIVTYEVSIKELGFNPEPYVIADALMYADGKPIVEIINMSLRYSGATRKMLRDIWSTTNILPRSSRGNEAQNQSSGVRSQESGEERQSLLTSAATAKKVLYDYERILAFAIGKPSDAFGPPYEVFNERRRIARLPGPPYQFLDRITEVQGEPFKMVAGGVAEAEYDVPPDAWYFAENRQGDMAFAVLLEIALQPCGWLAAYLGSALTSETDLSFRNLGGNGNQFLPVHPDTGTLTTRVKMTRVSSSAGMIIQWFDMEVHAKAGLVYKGDTYFGFFPKSALAHQEGIHNAKLYQPSESEMERSQSLDYPQQPPYAGEQLRMADHIDVFIPDGGPHKLGFIRGTKRVRAEEWFFKAHFYQDPVVPGSLGLESYLQLLKFLAIQRWGHQDGMTWEAVAIGQPHEWVYRGQIIPDDHLVTIEAVVTAINDEERLLTADGFLSVDGRVIYGMKHFTVRQQKIEAGREI